MFRDLSTCFHFPQKLSNSLQALHSIYAAKSRPRSVTLSRANRDDPLCFSIIGGSERNASIFISKVEKGSRASEAGLKRGDQVGPMHLFAMFCVSLLRSS